jgi:hypothetical protein
VSSVIAADYWPSMVCTALGLAPALTARDTAVAPLLVSMARQSLPIHRSMPNGGKREIGASRCARAGIGLMRGGPNSRRPGGSCNVDVQL